MVQWLMGYAGGAVVDEGCVGRWMADVHLRLAEQWSLEEQTLRLLLSVLLFLSGQQMPKLTCS